MKLVRVKMVNGDKTQGYGPGAIGEVHGYVQGGNGTPCAVVICKNKLVLVPFQNLEIIES